MSTKIFQQTNNETISELLEQIALAERRKNAAGRAVRRGKQESNYLLGTTGQMTAK